MTAADGSPVTGAVSADRGTWTVGEPLRFGQTYTVTGTATGTDGQTGADLRDLRHGRRTPPRSGTPSTPATTPWSAWPPRSSCTSASNPPTRPPSPQHVTLTSDPGRARARGPGSSTTTAAGRWTTGPRTTGRPAPRSTSSAKLYGVEFGARRLRRRRHHQRLHHRPQPGGASPTSTPTSWWCKQDGATVATYPASYGRGEDTGDPNLITRSGIHVVNELGRDQADEQPRATATPTSRRSGRCGSATTASSSTPTRPAAARRAARNVTHGCVNLSAGRRRGLLPLRDLGRPGRGHRHQRAPWAPTTATSTSGR